MKESIQMGGHSIKIKKKIFSDTFVPIFLYYFILAEYLN